MPLESATHIADLNTSNPVGSTDKVQTLDDHVRLIKSVLKTDLNLSGAVTASHAELNILDGATLSTAELNILDGVTLTAPQINDAARLSAVNVFTTTNTFTGAGGVVIQHTLPNFTFDETDAAADERIWRIRTSGGLWRLDTYTDAGAFTAGAIVIDRTGTAVAEIEFNATAVDLNGNLDVSGTSLLTGAVTAATIANSTSTTLVAGQLHFIDGDATLPNLTAGQWIQIVNDGASSRTISKNASDTTYYALTGASIATSFTLAARGVLTARCNPAGTAVYVTGSGITAAS